MSVSFTFAESADEVRVLTVASDPADGDAGIASGSCAVEALSLNTDYGGGSPSSAYGRASLGPCNKGSAPYRLHIQFYRNDVLMAAGTRDINGLGRRSTWSRAMSGNPVSCSAGQMHSDSWHTTAWVFDANGKQVAYNQGDNLTAC